MPGTIRVSVLEAVDLPEALTDGTVDGVFAKVRLGRRQFETESRVAVEGRTDPWNSAFVFFITNLQDKLEVTICDNADQCSTETSIEVPSIIEKGRLDEFVVLERGGRIHLIMSFVLTDQERKKIETLRREQERFKRTIVFENVQPISKALNAAVPAVTITEVDDYSMNGVNDSQEIASGPPEFGSTTRPSKPMLMFDYGRAVGFQSRQARQRQDPAPRKVTVGDVMIEAEVLCTSSFKGRDGTGVPPGGIEEDKQGIDGQSACFVHEAEAPIMAYPFRDRSILVGDLKRSSGFPGGATRLAPKGQMLIWNRLQAVQARSTSKDFPKFGGPARQCQDQEPGGIKIEARLGPGARWAQKTGLETRWTSPEKAGQIVGSEWHGQVLDQLKARAKILKLIKSTFGSRGVCGEDQRLQERHGLRDSIVDVLNKVVGGAAIFLAALCMMWSIPGGVPYGGDGSNEVDS